MTTFAIGVIHGMLEEMEVAFQYVEKRAAKSPDIVNLVTIGDYIDRGPDSWLCLRKALNYYHPNINYVPLRGNHEDLFENEMVYDPKAVSQIEECSGNVQEIRSRMLETLRDNYRIGNLVFSHATYTCDENMNFRDRRRIDLWERFDDDEDYLVKDENGNNLTLIHGHTPRYDVLVLEHRIDIDTALCFGNFLTMAEFDNNNRLVGFYRIKSRHIELEQISK